MLRTTVAISLALVYWVTGSACASTSTQLRNHHFAYRLEVLDANGTPLPVFWHGGESYILGDKGTRYVLRVHNDSSSRVEAVVSVDGLDVLDGKVGRVTKRGYLVPAYGQVDIEGWRLSSSNVAAFRFSGVKDSYAAKSGSARDVGVIGVAIFREYEPPRPPAVVHSYEPRDRTQGLNDALQGYAPESRGRLSAPQKREMRATRMGEAPSRSASADSARAGIGGRAAPEPEERPGLATEFGEQHYAPITTVQFVRASASRPDCYLGARYNDYDGLVALGVDVSSWRDRRDDTQLRRTAEPFQPVDYRFAAPPRGWRAD